MRSNGATGNPGGSVGPAGAANGAETPAVLAPLDYDTRYGFRTLFYKEWTRFWKVSVQTILAPVLTALLFLVVFSYSLRAHVEIFPGVGYTAFLVPGLAMMAVLQNAFANSSSSLMQSKMTGNIVFVLLPPFSHWEFFLAYLLAAVARGLVVGLGVVLATFWFVDIHIENPLWVIAFAMGGSGVMATLGIIAGLYSEKVDELAVFQNFIILPLTFLSGVFYSVRGLPPLWQNLSLCNPILYMVDGFRYGFFGQSDVSPWVSLTMVVASFLVLSAVTLWLIRIGYKLRH
jgi:ABC-2 type transport system permease protein